MKHFTTLNTLDDVKQWLQELQEHDLTLLSISQDSNSSYFEDLLNSPIIMMPQMRKLGEILNAIAEKGMEFDINTTNQFGVKYLTTLFNLPTIFISNVKKHSELAIKTMLNHFSLTADSEINPGQTVCTRFIEQTSGARLVKTLKNLVESNLLPNGVPIQDGLPLLPLNLAQALATKITDEFELQNVIALLKDKYNLNELACTILNNGIVQTDLALVAFSNEGIKIDFNLPSQNGVSGTALQILANKNIPHSDLSHVLDALANHTVNWEQNFNAGMHTGRNFMTAFFVHNHYMPPEGVLKIVKVLAKNTIDLGIKDQNRYSVLDHIANQLNHGADINKSFVQVIGKSGTKFVDAFVAFREKVKVSDMLKAYEGQEIDFNTPSQELGLAIAGLIMPMGMVGAETSLLKVLFNYVNDKEQFYKVMKLLKPYENINWSQGLNGVNGDSILDKIAAFDNIHNNALQTLQTAKIKYGLTLKLNSTALLTHIVNRIDYNQDPVETIKTIEELGFKVNKGLMAFVFADRKNISLTEAASLFPGAQLDEVLIQDLPMVAGTITKCNSLWSMKASFNQLIALGFNQWTDNFGNSHQFLGSIIQNCLNLQQVELALSILSQAQDIPWDFSHKGTDNQDVFDIMFMKPSYPGAMLNIIKLLDKFKNINWVEASNKMLTSPMINMHQMQLVDFVNHLPEEKVDLLKVVNGTTLLANLLSRVGDDDQLQTLMLMFKDKFQIDMNSKIGETEDHIISLIPHHLLHLDNLLPVLQNLGINIDWSSKNKEGTYLFAKVVQNSQQNMQVNINYLMHNIDKAHWKEPLDNEKNNLPLLITKLSPQNWDMVINILKTMDEQNNPILNINYKNTAGIRLIDTAELLHSNKSANANAVIQALRNLGSVEPKKPISISKADKLDLSNGRLDHYEPNQVNAPKIINVLYQKFPLSEEQVTQEISNYRSKDFNGWNNSKWHGINNQLTVPQVIDLLSGMTDVHDRLPTNWSFKKVLAHIIYVVRTSNDEGLSNSLTHCLSELHMCNLGKLINLLDVVQNRVLGGEHVNYAGKDFGDFQPILEASLNAVKLAFQEQSAIALTEWFYNIYARTAPEAWEVQTTKIQGILNKVFAETGDKKIESYHFNDGLNAQIIGPLIEKIKPGSDENNNEQVKIWQNMLYQGISIRVNKFFEQIGNAGIDQMEGLFDDVTYNAEKVYGNFITIGDGAITHHYNKMLKQNQEKAFKFLELLKKHCALNQDAIKFIDQEYGESLIDKLIKEPIQANELIAQSIEKFTTVDLRACSVKKITRLLDANIDNEELIHQLTTDKNIKISWVSVIENEHTIGNKHTLLSYIAHIAGGRYAPDAISLYEHHTQEWQNIISHNVSEIGKVDDQFGDLIIM